MPLFTCKTCGSGIDGTIADLQRHYRDFHPKPRTDEATDPPPAATPADGPPPGPVVEMTPDLGPDAVEPTPVVVKRSWRDRLWAGRGIRDVPRETSRERRPKVRRTPAVDILSGGWGLIGTGLIRTGLDVPVGQCLQYQAPIAGDVLDRVLAGTAVDRAVLQPIARHREEAEVLSALAGLPVLIFMYERANDELRAVLEPFLAEAIRAHLTAMVPVIRKKQARDRELAKVVDELRADGQLPDGVASVDDAVNAVFASIFATREETTAPAPAAPANNGATTADVPA